jgi:hypothetical protein
MVFWGLEKWIDDQRRTFEFNATNAVKFIARGFVDLFQVDSS